MTTNLQVTSVRLLLNTISDKEAFIPNTPGVSYKSSPSMHWVLSILTCTLTSNEVRTPTPILSQVPRSLPLQHSWSLWPAFSLQAPSAKYSTLTKSQQPWDSTPMDTIAFSTSFFFPQARRFTMHFLPTHKFTYSLQYVNIAQELTKTLPQRLYI